ncbi:MAG TPA: hypothetical protein VHA80_02020 [Solirubrobacterales bacterium]|nr:hypothetical protein [Solirubrobacterales bacterium]
MTTTAAGTERAALQIQLAYPTLRKAAEILGVDASTLSRRKPRSIEVGSQKRLAPRTVMVEAAYFNRRDPADVEVALIEVAEEQLPEAREAVEEELTAYTRERSSGEVIPKPDSDWLEEARSFLPDALFDQVRDVYDRADGPGRLSGPAPN